MTSPPLAGAGAETPMPGYRAAAWRLAVAAVFALAGATLPAAAYLVHMLGTGAINGRPDPFVYAMAYGLEWPARQGVLVTACLGLAAWLVVGAVDRLRDRAPAPSQRLWRGRTAGAVLAAAGLVMTAGVVVPAEAYHYFFRAHRGNYDSTSAYLLSPEGLAWAAWDGILAAACLWTGALLIRAAIRAWRH
ncbi:hypothetical protein AB0I28_32345 [Phytomonospora sp. NPDC050363]|uniref:hypothetical protein n=1 Tax=Phytomonospora sp. NPDC050363 TaxID=3155642 RepID=UPI00340E9EF2